MSHVRMLMVNSSAFNPIIPSKLITRNRSREPPVEFLNSPNTVSLSVSPLTQEDLRAACSDPFCLTHDSTVQTAFKYFILGCGISMHLTNLQYILDTYCIFLYMFGLFYIVFMSTDQNCSSSCVDCTNKGPYIGHNYYINNAIHLNKCVVIVVNYYLKPYITYIITP